MVRFIGIILTGLIVSAGFLQAEITPEFQKKLDWYKTYYPFISMSDTIYTFDNEFEVPEGYRFYDSTEIPMYSYWISHFPIWHDSKPIGNWKKQKAFEHDEVTRGIHLPWYGPSFKQSSIPIRLVGEFYNAYGKRRELAIFPKAGTSLTYHEWLVSDVLYNSRMEVMLKESDSVKQDTDVEWYRFLTFCMDNTTYASLVKNCDDVSEDKLLPGDLIIGKKGTPNTDFLLIIMNVIENEAGEKQYIVGTGCKEACDFHIPLLTEDRDHPWLSLTELKSALGSIAEIGFFRFKNVMHLRNQSN